MSDKAANRLVKMQENAETIVRNRYSMWDEQRTVIEEAYPNLVLVDADKSI